MLTVRDLVTELDLRLLAGEERADAPVRWVHSSELADPTPWLQGGELMLTTGMALTTPEAQQAYLTTLADHGLAGLGVGVGLGLRQMPAALIEAAGRRGFPLFEVPFELPFIAITERAATRLVNEQHALLQRSIAAQERLQRLVLSERGLDAVAGAIAGLVRGPALVFDGRGTLLAQRSHRRQLPDAVVAEVAEELHARARRGGAGRAFLPSTPALGERSLALPVGGDGSGPPEAWLVAARDEGPLAEVDRLVLGQAVTVVALELLRRRVADATERRLAGDVLSAAVAGELEGAELARRLQPFGVGGRLTALALAAPPRRGEAAEAALTAALRAEAVGGLAAQVGRFAVALLPGMPEDDLLVLAERLVARVGAELGERPFAGIGREVAAGRAREAFHEARCALEARELGAAEGEAGDPRGSVATFRDLGSFQLLLTLQDSDALRLYCDSLLGALEHGEGHYGGELLRSLEAFIECNGQWEAAARRLFCHRHTLRYRIRRIEELTGRDLGSARNRIEFWLALRGRELVSTPTEEVVA